MGTMNEKFDTKKHRLESLYENLKDNTEGDPQKSKSYKKSIEYLDKISELPFIDCLATYSDYDDMWDIWIWLDDNKEFTLVWNEDPGLIMSVYVDGELILSNNFDNIDEILAGWSKIIDKWKHRFEENTNLWEKIKKKFKK